MQPASLDRIDRYYPEDCHFKGPFNQGHGLAQTRRLSAHLFASLREPRFQVRGTVVQGSDCFLSWDLLFRFKRYSDAGQRVHGASHLKLAADGRIAYHRDYWDTAEELYEKLPLLGSLMRWLKRRVAR